jgi:hypothetical protein
MSRTTSQVSVNTKIIYGLLAATYTRIQEEALTNLARSVLGELWIVSFEVRCERLDSHKGILITQTSIPTIK